MPYTDHTQPNTAARFNQVAFSYDIHFNNTFDRAEEEVLFDDFLHLLQRADVLDIGCGTGLVKRRADRLLFKPHSYTGVDYSHGMIAAARSNDPDGTFIHADMVQFMKGQPAESLDAVTSIYFPMNYCEQSPFDVYYEARRILRPGGHMITVMASSRYPARQSHIVEANHLRRYFRNDAFHLADVPTGFEIVAVRGYNYFIERYRRWLNLCPLPVVKALFRFDQRRGEKSGHVPYFYLIHLKKLHDADPEGPLGM